MSEPDTMPFAAQLAQEIVEDHQLPIKRLAMVVGVDQATVYRWLAGERTVPLDLYRALFELTRDFRLIAMVAGRVPLTCTVNPEGPPPELADILPRALLSIESAAEAARALHRIVSDRRVDQSDAAALRDFRAAATGAVQHLTSAIASMQQHARAACVEV